LHEVDETLGFPKEDPHGSPIPPSSMQFNALYDLMLNQKAKISASQANEHIESELWELGLIPNQSILLLQKEKGTIQIKTKKSVIDIPEKLAKDIRVDL
jgi:Fe2+ transport system protein FeoA